MQQPDPFNWAFPQRKDLMYMSKIADDEFPGHMQRKIRAISQDYKYSEEPKRSYLNKVNYANRCDDIAGTKAPPQREVSRQPATDIDGAKPQVTKFKTGRVTNPLEPTYKLPTAIPAPTGPDVPFRRDPLDVRDIDGTKPKKDPWYNKIRNVDPYYEIEGSKPKQRFQSRDAVNRLDVTDINDKRNLFNRSTNPLEPTYSIRGQLIGPVVGSQPKVAHPDKNKEKSTSLNTDQIKGCRSGSVRESFYMKDTRKYFNETNKLDDIPGAQVGTKLKGLQTKRQTNPLNPAYVIPSF